MEARDRLRRALEEAGLGNPRPAPAAARPVYQQSLAPAAFSAASSTDAANAAAESPVAAFLPGFWQDTPAGRVFVVERRFDLAHQHGVYALGDTLDVPAAILSRIGRHHGLEQIDHRRLLYLDTETTGLAGGAGTLAFLVGVGHFVDGGFRLRQYFLDSLDREEALLRALADYLEPFEAIVSYNGKVFDVPLLETRFILSRLRRELGALPQLDLLFATRRFYRDRFGSCRLTEIERQVLGLTRVEDMPSFEVPALYFRYQRSRRFRALVPVFQHNALDVLSLVALMAHLAGLYTGSALRGADDRLALARVCEQDGQLLEAATHFGDALKTELPPVPRDEAERRLSLLWKRLGRWEEAVALWYRMARRPENRSLFAFLELAGYYERRQRDAAAAVVQLENALGLLRRHHLRLGARTAPAQEQAIERRLARLRVRAARQEQRRARSRRSAAVGAGAAAGMEFGDGTA